MAKDDSNRIRNSLTILGCETADGACNRELQHWFPFDERVPPTGTDGSILVYFDNVDQRATTLSGGGATVEEGVLVVDLIFSRTQLACGSVTAGEAYAEAGRIAASFTVGTTIHIASVASPPEGDPTPPNTTSKITITQQPIVGPGFMMRRNGESHIPVQIGYRAVTNGPD